MEVPGKDEIAWSDMLGYGIARPRERFVLNSVRFLHVIMS